MFTRDSSVDCQARKTQPPENPSTPSENTEQCVAGAQKCPLGNVSAAAGFL